MKKLLFTTCFVALACLGLLAQGTISGTIIDGEFAEGLIGANVVIDGTTTGASTDFDGKYQLKAEPGTYTIVVSYIGYAEKKIEGVEVKDGEVTYLDVTMSDDAVQLDLDVVVTAKVIERSENAVLLLQKKSDKIQDGISSQEMSKLAIGDAAGAMKKVTGATVSGGKYIYIRGLGDRYSLTQLNDLVLPSSDPYRNGAQLDLIPSNLLDNIITSKTFTPDQPGTFTGGAVNIKTKSFPEQFSLTFSSSVGFNSQNNFNDEFLTYEGGSTDYWGYDDGSRARPDVLEDADVLRTFELQTNLPVFARIDRDDEGLALANAADKAIKSLNRQFTPTEETSSIDHGYGITFGNQYSIGKNKNPLGVIASVSFNKKYQHLGREELTRNNWFLLSQQADTLFRDGFFNETASIENTSLNGMVGLSYKINNLNSISVNTIYNHNSEKSARYLTGERDNILAPEELQGRELYFQEREVRNLQLGGTHVLQSVNKAQIEWKVSQTNSALSDPNRRFFENQYDVQDDIYRIPASNVQRPFHFYRELEDEQRDYKLDFTFPIKNNFKLKFGGLYTDKSREFAEYRYQIEEHSQGSTSLNEVRGDTEAFLADSNTGLVGTRELSNGGTGYILGNYLLNRTLLANQYDGTDRVGGAYVMGTAPITDDLKFVGGMRFEKTDIEVTSRDTTQGVGIIDDADFLPSANLIYALNDQMNIRASYSRTIARPNMREMAPFEAFDPLTKTGFLGNPELKRTLIQNFDLRWEWFMNPGELVAVSGYYKDFKDAITLFREPLGGNFFRFGNVDNAYLYGIELEVRKDLEAFIPALKNFKLATNFSLINSSSDVQPDSTGNNLDPVERPFEGQADFILNASLIYSNPDNGLDAALSLNTTGDKLDIIGIQGTPDIYDRGRSQLDFTISKKFNNLSVRLTARNLLDSRFKKSSEYNGRDYVFTEFTRGITYGLSVAYTIK